MQMTILQPAQEIVLPPVAESEQHGSQGFSTSRDVKCLHCGFIAGQFIDELEERSHKRILRVSGQCPSEAVIRGGQMRCCRCGGPVYLDEIETIVRLRPQDLEKPRRGRKPKVRPED